MVAYPQYATVSYNISTQIISTSYGSICGGILIANNLQDGGIGLLCRPHYIYHKTLFQYYKPISAVCGGIYGGIMTSLYSQNGGTVQLCPNILQIIQCMHIYVHVSTHTSIVQCMPSNVE